MNERARQQEETMGNERHNFELTAAVIACTGSAQESTISGQKWKMG